MEIRNAKIKGTTLGYEDHNILTIFLNLDYGGSGQGFGGYALDRPAEERGSDREPSVACGNWIRSILDVVGVRNWEELPGKYIRVEADRGKVYRIGNMLEDKWFKP